MTRLQYLAGDFLNKDSLLPRLQRFQRPLLGDTPEFLVLDRQAVEFFTDTTNKTRLF